MKCAICGITVNSIEEAIDQDWIPFFYEGEEQHGPACAGCRETLLESSKAGEIEVKKQFRGKIIYDEALEEEPEEQVVMGLVFN